jgi:spore maturation protein CgeB
MKIVFVGDLSSYARAKQRYVAMEDMGHNVQGLSWVPLETDLSPSKPLLWERIRRKLGYPIDLVNLNQSLPLEVKKFTPDLIWIEKANTIQPKVYRKIKHAFPKTRVVYYSEDDIYVPNNRSIYLRESLSVFDVVYTTKPRNIEELPKLGAKRVKCVYQAYDKNFHRPLALTEDEKQTWGADVTFVGTFEPDRAAQMLFLAENGIQVRVWGSNWKSWQNKHPNLKVEGKAVYNDDFLKVISSTRINLNFLRKCNRDRHTSRSLEIPACKGFMLAERTDEHQNLFEEGKEAIFFDSAEELCQQVRYYLKHDQERETIALAGWQRCIESGYSHHDRLKVIFSELVF